MDQRVEAAAAPGSAVNTDTLSRQGLNKLVSYREAIAYAVQGRQIKQFTAMHEQAGEWALANGLQTHSRWLEDVMGSDPHGLFARTPWEPWQEATQWLMHRGWRPGEEGAFKIVQHDLMSQYVAASAGGVAGYVACIPSRMLEPMQHHEASVQARIVVRILTDLDKMQSMWQFPLLEDFLARIPDEVAIVCNPVEPIKEAGLAGLLGARVAAAQANLMQTATVPVAHERAKPRI